MYRPAPDRVVPQAVMDARAEIIRKLVGELRACSRCGGAGHLDENPGWVVVSTTGRKTCFRCWGAGTQMDLERGPDPLVVRYHHVDILLPLVRNGDVAAIAKKSRAAQHSPYWPVLVDLYDRATKAAAEVASAHDDSEDRDWAGEDEYERHEQDVISDALAGLNIFR